MANKIRNLGNQIVPLVINFISLSFIYFVYTLLCCFLPCVSDFCSFFKKNLLCPDHRFINSKWWHIGFLITKKEWKIKTTFLKRKIQSDYFKKNKSIKSSGFGQDIGNTLFIYFSLISLLSMPSFKITQPKSVD